MSRCYNTTSKTPLKLKRPTGIGRQCWVCVLVHFFLFFANFRKMLLISRIVAGHALVWQAILLYFHFIFQFYWLMKLADLYCNGSSTWRFFHIIFNYILTCPLWLQIADTEAIRLSIPPTSSANYGWMIFWWKVQLFSHDFYLQLFIWAGQTCCSDHDGLHAALFTAHMVVVSSIAEAINALEYMHRWEASGVYMTLHDMLYLILRILSVLTFHVYLLLQRVHSNARRRGAHICTSV
jgi:hypothetical protein